MRICEGRTLQKQEIQSSALGDFEKEGEVAKGGHFACHGLTDAVFQLLAADWRQPVTIWCAKQEIREEHVDAMAARDLHDGVHATRNRQRRIARQATRQDPAQPHLTRLDGRFLVMMRIPSAGSTTLRAGFSRAR